MSAPVRKSLPHTDFVELDTHRCEACWRCVDACARQVIGKVSVLWHKHAKLRAIRDCTGCLKCVAACPTKAMTRRGASVRPTVALARYRLNLGLLGTGVASLVSGLLIQFNYHMNHDAAARATRVWGLSYPAWALFHQLCSAMMLALVTWHLYRNRKPLFAMLARTGGWRRQTSILFALTVLAVVTALSAWTAGALFDNRVIERALVEIHDKVVIPMSVFMVMHSWQRRARLLR